MNLSVESDYSKWWQPAQLQDTVSNTEYDMTCTQMNMTVSGSSYGQSLAVICYIGH